MSTETTATEPLPSAEAPSSAPQPTEPAPVPPAHAPAHAPTPHLSKAELRAQRAAALEKQRLDDIQAAIDRASPRIQAILVEEGLLFDWGVSLEVGPRGEVRVVKQPLRLVPDVDAWRRTP